MCGERWAAGRPNVEEFAASTDPGWAVNVNGPAGSRPAGTGRRERMCSSGWEVRGPDVQQWLVGGADQGTVADACQVRDADCGLKRRAVLSNTWGGGSWCSLTSSLLSGASDQVIDLARLPEPLRWELAYVIQCGRRSGPCGSRWASRVVPAWAACPLRGARAVLARGVHRLGGEAVACVWVDDWGVGRPSTREVWSCGWGLDSLIGNRGCARRKRWTRQRLAGVGLEAVAGLTALTARWS